jgi:branched-subunit amino acid transport protein AzlD
MIDSGYLFSVIAAMAGATFLTRLLPFVAFRHRSEHPLLLFLGRYMPPAVMTILVLYSLKGVDFSRPPYGLEIVLAILVTVGVHRWRGQALLSIFSGTAVYMLLVQGSLLS